MRLIPDPERELDARNPLVLTLDDVLTRAECAALIERIDGLGPAPAPLSTGRGFVFRPDVRNNTRVMFDDAPLATRVLDRVRAHLPPRLEGEWVLAGANERLRCYRYAPGQYFGPHFDGAFARSDDERSLLTFLVYLSGCETGGETTFLDLEHAVRPAPGRALLFNHHLLHAGEEVRAGLKYVLRTDVMYRRA